MHLGMSNLDWRITSVTKVVTHFAHLAFYLLKADPSDDNIYSPAFSVLFTYNTIIYVWQAYLID